MRFTLRKSRPVFTSLVLLGVFVGVMVCGPLLSKANAPTTAITIVNNSGREVRHVFLSAPDSSNWSADQLGSSVVSANGGSVTINASCDGSSIRVIAEDQDGCFSYQVVSCSENATWTITSATARDCGN
jgi:TnpA family transposase